MKLYFANVVGMLREKVDAIKELRNSTVAQAKAIGEFILSDRLEEQEDIVFRVKEVCVYVRVYVCVYVCVVSPPILAMLMCMIILAVYQSCPYHIIGGRTHCSGRGLCAV